MPPARDRLRGIRVAVLLVLLIAALSFLLSRCPANRDGTPGQLAQAMEETTTAARSAAMSINQWQHGRSPDRLTSVALSDAREQIVNAYAGIAELRAEDPVDIDRQRMLTGAMTDIIGTLSAASGSVRGVTPPAQAGALREQLVAAADALENGYR